MCQIRTKVAEGGERRMDVESVIEVPSCRSHFSTLRSEAKTLKRAHVVDVRVRVERIRKEDHAAQVVDTHQRAHLSVAYV